LLSILSIFDLHCQEVFEVLHKFVGVFFKKFPKFIRRGEWSLTKK